MPTFDRKAKTLRLDQSNKLLNQLKSHASSTVKIFSDEKLFSIGCTINRRIDRFIVQKGDKASPVCHTKQPQSVMMLGIIASNGEKCLSIIIKIACFSFVYISSLIYFSCKFLQTLRNVGEYQTITKKKGMYGFRNLSWATQELRKFGEYAPSNCVSW